MSGKLIMPKQTGQKDGVRQRFARHRQRDGGDRTNGARRKDQQNPCQSPGNEGRQGSRPLRHGWPAASVHREG